MNFLKSFVVFILCLFSFTGIAFAEPEVVAVANSANTWQCESATNLLDAYLMSKSNLEKVKSQILNAIPGSDRHKLLSKLLPLVEQNIEDNRKLVASLGQIEMATAQVKMDGPRTIPLEKINDLESIGKITILPSQTDSELLIVSAPVVKLTLYGPRYCRELAKAGQDSKAAVSAILKDLLAN